ncbi:hypothetical protein [Streptomyces fragilis]|uniref:Nuclear transport factor 2 family protein n=1 Tax=Streptomyces fragilis TaxID=67301 RepID=A0ABV2YKK7_9ACTN|nr:hypothetical protein [Streptomyces fragilis]
MHANPSTTRNRHVRRTALAVCLAAAVALPLGLTASAQATTPAATAQAATKRATPRATALAAQRTITGRPAEAVTRVADFYGAYVDAKGDYADPDPTLATALRGHYLAPEFAARLAAWETDNGVDGVLRAQNIPAQWSVADNGAVGNGHEVVVTLTFGSGDTAQRTRLYVLLGRYDRVVDIQPTSAR